MFYGSNRCLSLKRFTSLYLLALSVLLSLREREREIAAEMEDNNNEAYNNLIHRYNEICGDSEATGGVFEQWWCV